MLNKVIMMGRLTAEPQVNETMSGKRVCHFSIAVDRTYKREGEPDTDFFDVDVWGKNADFVEKYFRKGSPIVVSGSIHNRKYTKSDGTPATATTITADDVQFTVSDKRESTGRVENNFSPAQSNPSVPQATLQEFEDVLSDGEIPF